MDDLGLVGPIAVVDVFVFMLLPLGFRLMARSLADNNTTSCSRRSIYQPLRLG